MSPVFYSFIFCRYVSRYGYRGEMLDWDFIYGVYRVNGKDSDGFTEEPESRYDDFHRLYAPYQRLVGSAAMRRYLSATNAKIPLHQYLKKLSDDSGYSSRGAVMPVYRPLERIELEEGFGDIGSVDAPRQLLDELSGSQRGGRSCHAVAVGNGDPNDAVFTDNFLAVSHVQQTGV